MNENYFKYISLIFLFVGIVFLLDYSLNITGAVVGVHLNLNKLNLFFSGIFLMLSFISSSPGRKSIGKLERKIVNLMAVAILTGYTALLGHAHFAPRQTTATIENVTTSEYQNKKVYIVETSLGKYRNDESFLYGKHKEDSDRLQETAKSLIGRKVKIKNYGYSRGFQWKEYPARNILDIREK